MVSISGTRSEKPLLNCGHRAVRQSSPSLSRLLQMKRAKRNRPIWNFNFTGAQKLPRFDDRDTALGKAGEIEEHLVGFERQWDHSFGWLDMVGKPNRRSHAGGCLLPDVLREDRRAVTVLGKNHTTRKSRHARANDCDVSLAISPMVVSATAKKQGAAISQIAV